MSDVPPTGAAPGAGGSEGPGGGHTWLPRYMQRSRTPGAAANFDEDGDGETPVPPGGLTPSKPKRVFKMKTPKIGAKWGRSVSDGVLTHKTTAANDGGDDLASDNMPATTITPPTPTTAKKVGDKEREKEWERLEAQYKKEQYEARYQPRFAKFANRDSENSGYGSNTTPQSRAGIALSSLLNLTQRGKGPSPFFPLTPSGVDPRTPVDNAWRIQEIASGPGILGGPSPVGHDRFPKVQPRTSATEPWNNPNLLQQIESLQSAMMKKRDPVEQIPAVYNSCVLVMIEACYKMITRLRAIDSQTAEINKTREKELEQFRGISEEWIQRENGYRAEIKRLELLLAKESKDGVASVAVARSNSLVDRSGTKRFQARLKRMSGSQQEEVGEQTVKEEPEPLDAPRETTYYRTLADIPQCFDDSKDVTMSRLVEKKEKEDRQRRALEALKQSRAVPRNTSKDTTGYQKQTSTRPAVQQETSSGELYYRSAVQALGKISELKGVVDTALNDIDDGLTVGREGYRTNTTVKDGSTSTTGSSQHAKHEPMSGLSAIRGEPPGVQEYNQGPAQSSHRRGRRYSFSCGDDEVLPVTPSLTAGIGEAESRGSVRAPTSTSSITRLGGVSGLSLAFNPTGLPLSTSTDSTGSVVWLGGSGTPSAVNPDHQTGYTNSPSRRAKNDSHKTNVSASVFTPEQARGRAQDPELPGSVVYSPMRHTETSSARYTRDGAGSPSTTYPSVPAVAALDPDTCQDKKSSSGGTSVASLPLAFTPAYHTTPPGAISGLSPAKVSAKASETASGKAVMGDGGRN